MSTLQAKNPFRDQWVNERYRHSALQAGLPRIIHISVVTNTTSTYWQKPISEAATGYDKDNVVSCSILILDFSFCDQFVDDDDGDDDDDDDDDDDNLPTNSYLRHSQ